MLSFTIQHIMLLWLIKSYHYQSARALHNHLFLVSAETNERKHLCFYDFVRTGFGAHSSGVQKLIDDLKREQLIDLSPDGLSLTDKGKLIYSNLASSLLPFKSLCELSQGMVNRYGDNPEEFNHAVFYHLLFRRAKMGKRIFPV